MLRLRVYSHTTFSSRAAGSEPGLQTCCRSSDAGLHRFTLPTKPSLPMHCRLGCKGSSLPRTINVLPRTIDVHDLRRVRRDGDVLRSALGRAEL
eukprot:3374498-Heterocapsa_arctica.AAC.1